MSPRLLAFALILSTFGCNPFTRIGECRRLSKLVNARLDSIEARAKKGTPAEYRAAASEYASLAREVRTTPWNNTASGSLLQEYSALLESVVPALTTYASAVEQKDNPGSDEARRSLERITRQERGLVSRIDAQCAPR